MEKQNVEHNQNRWIGPEEIKKGARLADQLEEQNIKFQEDLPKIAQRLAFQEHEGIRKETIFGNVKLVQCKEFGAFSLLDKDGNTIIPLGRYSYIDSFDRGYARVNIEVQGSRQKKWGIINMAGEEVVPLVYDSIWSFFERNKDGVRLEKDGNISWFDLNEGKITYTDPWYKYHRSREDDDIMSNNFYDSEGNLDINRIEDAYLDGEYVPDDC